MGLARVAWSAAPHRDANGQLLGVLASVCYGRGKPDWKTLQVINQDLQRLVDSLISMTSTGESQGPAADEWQLQDNEFHSTVAQMQSTAHSLQAWCQAPSQMGRHLEPTWFALEPFLIRLALQESRPLRRRALTVWINVEAARGLQICAEPWRLEELFTGLVRQATQGLTEGSIALRVEVRLEPLGPQLVLTFTSEGQRMELPAIPADPLSTRDAAEEDGEAAERAWAAIYAQAQGLGLDLEIEVESAASRRYCLLVHWRRLRDTNSGVSADAPPNPSEIELREQQV
jgi:hypothetical protein